MRVRLWSSLLSVGLVAGLSLGSLVGAVPSEVTQPIVSLWFWFFLFVGIPTLIRAYLVFVQLLGEDPGFLRMPALALRFYFEELRPRYPQPGVN